MRTPRLPPLGQLMAVFALSGFAGLIYQSIWSHYLGLTLGHAAYAQSLVLAIFMGGMALGSWLASRLLVSLINPVRTYAKIELAIGILGLVFHACFLAYTQTSQATILPQLAGTSVHLYQWTSAALLILPQCILLGMTFPLMAAGCLRMRPDEQGRSLGGLYFTNSLGAALGALVATFALLPWIGMPGAMAVAGVINVMVAILAWVMSRPLGDFPGMAMPANASAPTRNASNTTTDSKRLLGGILVAAAITGGTSFVYEIVWVRMLNLALGTTLHSFELMLAAFILGLAAGAYWIHRRGDRSGNLLRLAGIVQVLMGIAALASAFAFSQSFHWVGWMVRSLPHTDSGYTLYNLGCAGIALLVMFPAAFFAGATLPLFTLSLLRSGRDERSVGWVFAGNTVGAIAGVLMAMHLLIPMVGLHLSLVLAAALDVVLGLVLLRCFGGESRSRDLRIAGLTAAAVLASVLQFGRPDPIVQVSGVFRTGILKGSDSARLAYLADGKTATVSVLMTLDGGEAAISTNGKPDAGMTTSLAQAPLADEATMIIAAALPLALHPAPRDVAIIGWGSGLTTHTYAGSDRVARIDTIEIEPAMYQGAKSFGSRVARAYQDPRSRVIFDDARTYFSAGQKRYDIIFSEPSNPWVSGVASLFTEEFYDFLRGHLRRDGLFVQWLQTYEISDALQAKIVAAMLKKFPNSEAYMSAADLILVASQGDRGTLDAARLQGQPLRSELARVGLDSASSFQVRRIGGPDVLKAYVRMLGADGHSDYYPEVALGAPKSRFLDENAGLLSLLVTNGMPVLDVLDGRKPIRRSELIGDTASNFIDFQIRAGAIVDAFGNAGALDALKATAPDEARNLALLLALSSRQVSPAELPEWSTKLAAIARHTLGALATEDLTEAWIRPAWLAPAQSPEVSAVMAAYRAAAERDAVAMRERATAVLALEPSRFSDTLREQMLLIAMTGAAGQRDFAKVRELEGTYGQTIQPTPELAQMRRFLLAWADQDRTN